MKLFGVILLITGIVTGYFSLTPMLKSFKTSNWKSVPAIVIEAKLKSSISDDTTIYKATGKYQYNWNGRSYTSRTLNFNGGADNVGSYQRDLVDKLSKAQASNKNIVAWVNPDRPSEAVIDKTLRWSKFLFILLFCLIFAGVGAGFIFAASYIYKAEMRETERKQFYPNKPWRWHDDWQTLEVKSNSKKDFLFSMIFASFWCVVSLPILFIIPDEVLVKKNYLALIGLMFPIIGIGLAKWGINNFFRWKRFKNTVFILDRMPFFLGQRMKGTLRIPEKLPTDTQFNVKLTCIHKYTSGSDENSSTNEVIKWQDEQHIPIIAGSFSDKYFLPIQFKIPNNQPISSWENPRSQYLWRLSIESDIKGADFMQDFSLPVFDSSDKQYFDVEDIPSTTSNYDSTVYTYKGDWQKLEMEYQDKINYQRYFFPAGRHKGIAFLGIILGLIFSSFGIVGFFIEKIPFMIALIFSVLGLLIIYGGLRLWLFKMEIKLSQSQLIVRSGMFSSKEIVLNSHDIQTLSNKVSMFVGKTQYYDIHAETLQGRKIRIAPHLKGIRDVDALMKKINDDLGLANN